MGIVRMGPPTDFVLFIKEAFGVKNFIETGTYMGSTAIWAASHFESVLTVENSREIFQQTCAKHGDIPNLKFMFGDSRSFLGEVVGTISNPALFWIDSHWCGSNSYGEKDQCPLLDEINELNKASVPQFILIDDARLFTAPPPLPNDRTYWPSIDQVIDMLKNGPHQYYVTIYDDVIIVIPQYAKDTVSKFLQNLTTKAWNEMGVAKVDENNLDGLALIRKGAKILLNQITDKVFRK